MNWESIFLKYRKYVEHTFNTEVTIYVDPYQKPLFKKIDFFVDGCAFVDDEFSQIDLYVESFDRYDLLLSVLIHEIGHVICWNKYRDDHTEEDAWMHGKSILEQNEIPECFDLVKMEALATYVKSAEVFA